MRKICLHSQVHQSNQWSFKLSKEKYHLATLKSCTQRQPSHICSTVHCYQSLLKNQTQYRARGRRQPRHHSREFSLNNSDSTIAIFCIAWWWMATVESNKFHSWYEWVWHKSSMGQVGNRAAAAQADSWNHVPWGAIFVWRTSPYFHKRQLLPGVATELGNRRQDEEEGSLKMPAMEQLAPSSKAGMIGTQWKGHWILCYQIHTTIKITTVLRSPATGHRVHWFEQHLE